MIIRLNLRDDTFQKRPKMYVSSFKVAVVGGSEEKIRLNLRGDGISSRDVRNFQFAFGMWLKTFELLGDGVIIRLSLHDGIFPKRPKMFVSSFKIAVFGGSGEKIRLNLRGYGMSSRGSKIFSSRSLCRRGHLFCLDLKCALG